MYLEASGPDVRADIIFAPSHSAHTLAPCYNHPSMSSNAAHFASTSMLIATPPAILGGNPVEVTSMPISQIPSRLAPHPAAAAVGIPLFRNAQFRRPAMPTSARKRKANHEKQKNERTNPISPNPNPAMLVQRNFAVLGACPRAPRRKRSFASTFGAVAIKHPSICAWRPARRGRNALVHHNSGDKSELSSFPMNRTQDKVFQGPHLTMSRGGSIITADEWLQQESGTGGMNPYYLQPKDKPIRPSIINGNKAKGLLRDQDTRME